MLTINTRHDDYIWYVGQKLPNILPKDVVMLFADESELDYLEPSIKAESVHQDIRGNKYLLVIGHKAKLVFESLS